MLNSTATTTRATGTARATAAPPRAPGARPALARARARAAPPVVAAARLRGGAPPVAARRPRARALRLAVQAYREHRDAGRERAICDLGDRVVGAMMRIMCRLAPSSPPPSSSALAPAPPPPDDVCALRGDTAAAALEVRIDGVLERQSLAGADALLAWLESERSSPGAPACDGWSIVASAACPLDDAYFALVETTHPRAAAAAADAADAAATTTTTAAAPEKERAPLVLHKIVWLDVELDDTKRLVSGVHVRGQLAPDDLSNLASVDGAHRALSATPFPHERVKPYPPGLNVDAPLGNLKRWCDARSSANDERVLLFGGGGGDGDGDGKAYKEPAVSRAEYRLWDAFGVLPVLCSPQRRMTPDACVVPGEAVAEIIAGAKDRFEIECRMQDAAISMEKNVGFTRWLSSCVDKRTGAAFKLEGLEAVVFDESGRILDTWLFRDPTPGERARLLGE